MYNWFQSYLTNRKQFVRYNNITSPSKPVFIGVPQGTILGPILFLIYTNDFTNLTSDSLIVKYADDSSVVSHSNELSSLNNKMQTAVNEGAKWLNDNRMVINPNKSNYIIIGHLKITCQNSFNLHINNNPLTPCTNAKLLGIIIDDQLCWKNHVEFLLKKTAPKLGLLRRLRFNLPSDLLQNLYMAIIQPFIDYCISVVIKLTNN